MQVYVKKDCINSSGDYLAANTIATIDKSKDAKLIDLGLVEEFDVKKHKVSDTKEAKVVELEKENQVLTEEKSALEAKVVKLEKENQVLTEEKSAPEAKVVKLDDFVKAAIALPKGQTPEGYEGI